MSARRRGGARMAPHHRASGECGASLPKMARSPDEAPGIWPGYGNQPARVGQGGWTMVGLCEGRVCIVTGAGRGIGREHSLMLAEQGAKVVVNDLGGSMDGSGRSTGPAQEVVDEIVAAGGEAVVNGDDISTWDGSERLVRQAIDAFGRLDVVVNNAGILRDRMLANMTEAKWDAMIQVHLKGTFGPSRHAAAYWREQTKAGETVD